MDQNCEKESNEMALVAKCHICKKQVDQYQLKIHEKVHLTEKNHVCDTCGKEFSKKDHLTKHKKEVHDRSRIIFQCNICNKAFKRYAHLKSHYDMLHAIKDADLKCNICSKCFNSLEKLQSHISSHERKYKSCEICFKQVATSQALLSHYKSIHEENKPYYCILCDRYFTLSHNFQKHKSVVHLMMNVTHVESYLEERFI